MDATTMQTLLETTLPAIRAFATRAFEDRWGHQEHQSTASELIQVLQGSMTIRHAHGACRCRPGSLALIPRGVRHRDIGGPEGHRLFYLSFEWEHLDVYLRLMPDPPDIPLRIEADPSLHRALERLAQTSVAAGIMDEWVARSRLLTILLAFARIRRHPPSAPDRDAEWVLNRRRRERLLQKVRVYIDTHYMDEITLEKMAREVRLSPYYLSHVFSRESDFSLFEYLASVRMQAAAQQLHEGRLSVKEVAHAVGFRDSNYFSRAFKRVHGMPPGQFRNRLQ